MQTTTKNVLINQLSSTIMSLGGIMDQKNKEYDSATDRQTKETIAHTMVVLHNQLDKLLEQFDALVALK